MTGFPGGAAADHKARFQESRDRPPVRDRENRELERSRFPVKPERLRGLEGNFVVWRFIAKRLLETAVVVLGVSVIVFVLLRIMPGDPVQLLFGEGDDADLAASREMYRQMLGLDRPLPVQYLIFLKEIFTLHLGNSLVRGGEPVIQMVGRALPLTIELSIFALVIGLLIAIPVAVLCALKQNTFWDRGGTGFALIGASMPNFWQGILLIMFLAVWMPVFPVSGVLAQHITIERITGAPFTDAVLTGNWEGARSAFMHLVLPATTLGTTLSGQFVRVLRSSLLEVKHQEFVHAFRARGIGEPTIVSHLLHNALPTTVVIIGMRIGMLLSGTIVIETLFAYPGMGFLLVQGINARDFPVVQGVVVLLTVLVVLSNLIADIIHAWLDPRVKLAYQKGK